MRRAEFMGGIGEDARAEDVVLDRLRDIRLHQRDVLMSCRMEHDLRAVLVENLSEAGRVADVGDDWDNFRLQFADSSLEIVHGPWSVVSCRRVPCCRRLTTDNGLFADLRLVTSGVC